MNSLATIIQEFKQGNFDNYQEFYEITAPVIYKLTGEIVEDDQAVGTLITDIYNNIYANINSCPNANSFYSWAALFVTDISLGYILGHENINKMVERDVAASEEISFITAAEDDERFIPESILRDIEVQRVIQQRIDALPIIHKIVLQYFYYEGLDIHTIANRMQLDVTCIKQIVAQIRNEFKKYVAESGSASSRLYSLAQLPAMWLIFANIMDIASFGVVGAAAATAGTVAVTNIAETGAAGTSAVAAGATGTTSVAGTGATATAGTTGASAAAEAATGAGVRIAIGAVALVAVGSGVGVAIHQINKEKEETTEAVTEITEEITTSENIVIETEEVTEETTEEVTEAADDTGLRYAAYYDVVYSYMEQYPSSIVYSTDAFEKARITGFACAQLVDFNGDGDEQLVLSRCDEMNENAVIIDVYDYKNDSVESIGSFVSQSEYWQPKTGVLRTYLKKYSDNTYTLAIFEGSDSESADLREFGYVEGSMQSASKATEQKDYDIYLYYCFNDGSGYRNIGELTETLLLKHKTILELAMSAGDEEFVNNITNPGYTFEETGERMLSYCVKTQINKYNESYIYRYSDYYIPTLSANERTLSCSDYEGQFYLSYIDDALVLVNGTIYEANSWILSPNECYFEETDYSYGLKTYEEISADEYNRRVEAILNE